MITAAEKECILANAYVPEHLPDYAARVSGGEAFLVDGFPYYLLPGGLAFVGFPLQGRFEEKRLVKAVEGVIRKRSPAWVTLVAPSIPPRFGPAGPPDFYYRLDLKGFQIPAKVKNMARRASREFQVGRGRDLDSGHLRLIREFSASRPLEEGTRTILARIPQYLSASPTAWVFSARTDRGELAAFDVAEFAPSRYAFYMFNFRDRQRAAPGASDLLLSEVIRTAKEQGKEAVNLGLGISPGVAFFKKKWGGRPFLEHRTATYRPSAAASLEGLLSKL